MVTAIGCVCGTIDSDSYSYFIHSLWNFQIFFEGRVHVLKIGAVRKQVWVLVLEYTSAVRIRNPLVH